MKNLRIAATGVGLLTALPALGLARASAGEPNGATSSAMEAGTQASTANSKVVHATRGIVKFVTQTSWSSSERRKTAARRRSCRIHQQNGAATSRSGPPSTSVTALRRSDELPRLSPLYTPNSRHPHQDHIINGRSHRVSR
jgi:hypothetical protein